MKPRRTCCQPIPIPDSRSPYCTGAWVAGLTLGQAEYHHRAGSMTQAQWDAYAVSWCAMAHDPRTCNDLLGHIRAIGSTFHYLQADGMRATTHWPETESPESVLERTYGVDVAAKSRATWNAHFPPTPMRDA